VTHGELAIVDRNAYYGAELFTHVEHDDLGYSLCSDALLELNEIPDERLLSVCLHCLIDRYPDLGRGLDIARETGVAFRDGDDWLSASG
jgi:hypothetical protein